MEPKEITCRHCGKNDKACYSSPIKDRMIEDNRCFVCDHWLEWEKDASPYRVITEHSDHDGYTRSQHIICAEDSIEHPTFRGYYGQRFFIRFKDGRDFTTTNLWHQGTIPPHLYHLFHVNAEFVGDPGSIEWNVLNRDCITEWKGNNL